jgi:hypothetical protein
MLVQTVTPQNLPLQQVMTQAQQWAVSHGASVVQGQMMGLMVASRQVAATAAVMAFDDVFRVTAAITLLAIVPAVFMRTSKPAGPRGPTIVAD